MDMISDYEELQSRTIKELRFLLIVLVVLIHSNITEFNSQSVTLVIDRENFPTFWFVSTLLSGVISKAAVPLFYFISGYLFFYKVNSFTLSTYYKKIRKRFRTLFVPYIFWNVYAFVIICMAIALFPSMMSGRNYLISEWGIGDYLNVFWCGGFDKSPINVPLWFVRDLMVTILLSPVIYFLIRNLKYLFLGLLGFLYFFYNDMSVPGLSVVSVFFFTIGSYFSINRWNFAEVLYPHLKWLAFFYLLSISLFFVFYDSEDGKYLYYLSIIIGIFFFISSISNLLSKHSIIVPEYFKEATFFVYVYHGILAAVTQKSLIYFLSPISEAKLFVIYILSASVLIIGGCFLFHLLNHAFPKIMAFVTGGRTSQLIK